MSSTRMLLITANVGTIFENLEELLDPWLEQLRKKIDQLNPEFIALHMQELGGKNYKTSMQLTTPFFKKLLDIETIRANFNRYLIIIDSDFTDDANFTSLCNIYLLRNDLHDVQLYNFYDRQFYSYANRQIFSGSLKSGDLFLRERFAKDFFKENQWSRKGFLHTKWAIKGQVYDLVNIHLFHDPSNLVSMTASPSIYSESRRKALEYCLSQVNKTHQVGHPTMLLVFGDFNFRLDLASFVNDYSKRSESSETRNSANGKLERLVCRNQEKQEVFTIEDKKFIWHYNQPIQTHWKNLIKYDIELPLVGEKMHEFDKTFPPSYPFMEELSKPDEYMNSRCPAWCDRIIFNTTLKQYLDANSNHVEYGMIGLGVCMGDHKPIYLFFDVKSNPSSSDPVKKSDDQHSNHTSSTIDHAYLNRNLVHLKHSHTDIHDFALFKNVKPLSLHGANAFKYRVDNVSIDKDGEDESHSVPVLNDWLKSLAELKLRLINNSNELDPERGCGRAECNCIDNLLVNEHSVKSSLTGFFVDSLRGNLFKLKHLHAHLNQLLLHANSRFDLSNNTNATVAASIDSATSHLIRFVSNPVLEHTPDSYSTLSQIVSVLHLPCTVNLFKQAIQTTTTTTTQSSRVVSIEGDTVYDENFNIRALKSIHHISTL